MYVKMQYPCTSYEAVITKTPVPSAGWVTAEGKDRWSPSIRSITFGGTAVELRELAAALNMAAAIRDLKDAQKENSKITSLKIPA